VKLDWDKITDQDFEELCYEILSIEGFVNIKWLGRGGGDRGRDILCSKAEPALGNLRLQTTYLVQCKKWVARPPTPSDLNNAIAWADAQNPHVFLIMVSHTLSADTHDWVSQIQKKKPYQILTFEEKDFELFLEKNLDLHKKYFERKENRAFFEPKKNEIQNSVIMCLVDKSEKGIERISKEIGQPVSKIEPILAVLQSKGAVTCSKDKKNQRMKACSLNSNLAAFKYIASNLLLTNHRFVFLLSPYAKETVNKDLVESILSRHFLQAPEQFKEDLMKIIRISPTALHHSLFSDNRQYQTGYLHLQRLKVTEEIRRKWASLYVDSFKLDLVERMLVDLRHPDCKRTLGQYSIEGFKVSIGIRMASIEERILDLNSESLLMLVKAKGDIQAGSLVSATEPDLFIRVGTILINLGLLEQAISQYDLAIQQVKDREKLKIAWNNKGVCLMRLQRCPEAISCFDEALKIDPNFEEAQGNKQKCFNLIKSKSEVQVE